MKVHFELMKCINHQLYELLKTLNNINSKRYTTVSQRHMSQRMNFGNQMWRSNCYPGIHLSAYKPHSKTFHNRWNHQLLRSCGKKIHALNSMWWYSCQKDSFPNPLLPIVHCCFHKLVRSPKIRLFNSLSNLQTELINYSFLHAIFLGSCKCNNELPSVPVILSRIVTTAGTEIGGSGLIVGCSWSPTRLKSILSNSTEPRRGSNQAPLMTMQ